MISRIRSWIRFCGPLVRAHTKGFSLVEVVISLALVNIVVIGSLTLIGTSAASMKKSNDLSWRNIENDEMIKLLTEPTYFSRLAGYDPNKSLSECMLADGVVCTQGTDYPLTAFDFKSGEPLNTVSGAASSVIRNTITFQVHCQNNAESCDQATYFIVKVKTIAPDANGTLATVQKSAMVVPKMLNMVSFIPDSVISAGRTVNLILFMDASGSMAVEKDKIKGALDGLLAKLSMMNVNVGIFPLNGIVHTTETYLIDAFGNQVPVPGGGPDVDPSAIFYWRYKYDLNYGHNYTLGEPTITPSYRTILFSQTDSAADRATKVNAAKSLIDYYFLIDDPKYVDAPLCGLIHYLEKPNPIFPIDPMTPTVAMIISNEDDGSILVKDVAEIPHGTDNAYNLNHIFCMDQLDRRLQKQALDWVYFVKDASYYVSYTSDFNKDGVTMHNIPREVTFPVTYKPGMAPGQNCLGDAHLASLADAYLTANDSYYGGNISVTSCQIAFKDFRYSTNLVSTLCAANEGDLVASRASYVPNSCWVRQHDLPGSDYWDFDPLNPVSIVQAVPTDVTAHATSDLVLAAYDAIQARLNTKNFYYIPVIHGSSTGCPLTPGSEIGARYEALATKLGMTANITPVCAADYTGPIDQIQGLLDKLGAADITVPAWLASKVTGVEIQRGATILHPARDVDYKLDGNIIMFSIDYIQPTDIIRVFYQ